MTDLADGFVFGPLGNTGEGRPVLPWARHKTVWELRHNGRMYAVSRQGDVPACAYRCHYPDGSAPCDLDTALDYIAYIVEGALR